MDEQIPDDYALYQLAETLGAQLLRSQHWLVTAESCTGGWIGKVLTDVPGSSRWYRGGIVAYSNELKRHELGVSEQTLAQHGAVSESTVREMAHGVMQALGGDYAIAVTGIAGPDGGQPSKPVGTVWLGWAERGQDSISVYTAHELFTGDREAVRRMSVSRALQGLLKLISQRTATTT